MPETPRVTISDPRTDVLGREDAPAAAPRIGRLPALALAALVGFGVAQAVPQLAGDRAPGSEAGLTLVTGRQPFLDALGEPPVPSLEVVLVNAGPRAVRLLGATVPGTAVRWDADRRLDAGQQATAVLREEGACDRESDLLSRAGGRQLVVQVQDGPQQRLALEPAVGRAYDDHVRNVCNLPRLPQALELLEGTARLDGDVVKVSFGLLSRTVRPLRVLDVTAVAGLDVTLTDADGRPVDLPLDVPGVTREQIYVFPDTSDPATTPYRVRISAASARCPELQAAGDGAQPVVSVVYEGDEQEGLTASRPLFVDLAEYAQRLCS